MLAKPPNYDTMSHLPYRVQNWLIGFAWAGEFAWQPIFKQGDISFAHACISDYGTTSPSLHGLWIH